MNEPSNSEFNTSSSQVMGQITDSLQPSGFLSIKLENHPHRPMTVQHGTQCIRGVTNHTPPSLPPSSHLLPTWVGIQQQHKQGSHGGLEVDPGEELAWSRGRRPEDEREQMKPRGNRRNADGTVSTEEESGVCRIKGGSRGATEIRLQE